ncbi:MAG: DUF2267 domain-containing protein [Bacteroidetes bacterium]|nr:MAG: DUF2267 domain-containing protein [Bacteroidota bacterium]
MPLDFEKQAQKGNKFLKDVAEELGNKADTSNAGRMLQAVLHTLRNHLPFEENLKLLSQLPIALKGVYVHEWSPEKKRDISRKRNDFIEEVLRYADGTCLHGFSDIQKGTEAVHAVFKTLKQYISPGEFNKMEAVLPDQLKKLVRESIYSKTLTLNLASKK